MKTLSIIILTCNQQSVLRRCLDSLLSSVHNINSEIIIVDNGSTDGTTEMLSAFFPTIKVIVNPENLGVAMARNQGIKASTGKYILILDNDTIVNHEAIAGMLDYIQSHPEAGVVACRLLNSDKTVQQSLKPYPGLMIKLHNVLGIKGRETIFPTSPDGTIHPTYVIGACQMFRRQLIENIGMLDSRIFYGPEDADFCIRATKAGYKICYLPNFSIEHLHRRATTHKLLSPLARKHFVALIYFYLKHRRLW